MNSLLRKMSMRHTACASLCILLCHISAIPAAIYRWQDSAGSAQYGDVPPPDARQLKRLHPTAYDSYGLVANVIDGDTLDLADGRRVRLLGINAPEVAHHGRPGEALGEKAKQVLYSLVADKRIRLRFDMQHYDHYHRLLARIYLEDGTEINPLLLQQGLARAMFVWPNMEGAERYYSIEKVARQHRLGVWALPTYQIQTLDTLLSQRNRFTRLRARLSRIEKRGRYNYLWFTDKLRVAIKQSRMPLFKRAGINFNRLIGHRLTLRGWLGLRHGVPYLELGHPFQLEATH